MAYCTQADIEKSRIPVATLIQLTDDADLNVVDAATVAGAIKDADGLIDGFLKGRYPLPLNPVPDMIATISVNLSTYYLYARKPEFEMPKTVSDQHQTALKLLERIQDGKMQLSEDADPVAVNASSVSCSMPERLFNRQTMRGF